MEKYPAPTDERNYPTGKVAHKPATGVRRRGGKRVTHAACQYRVVQIFLLHLLARNSALMQPVTYNFNRSRTIKIAFRFAEGKEKSGANAQQRPTIAGYGVRIVLLSSHPFSIPPFFFALHFTPRFFRLSVHISSSILCALCAISFMAKHFNQPSFTDRD